MPLYIVTCNGSLRTASGPIATGGDVEMSEAEAKSLPPGTVALKACAATPAPLPETPPAPPAPTPPVTEAPRGRKAKS